MGFLGSERFDRRVKVFSHYKIAITGIFYTFTLDGIFKIISLEILPSTHDSYRTKDLLYVLYNHAKIGKVLGTVLEKRQKTSKNGLL